MTRRIITLTTDFGVGSPYVAAMKGVILSINPEVDIVDITHAIRPQDVRQGAIALEQACRWFPPGAIHVAVVDPGVGSRRRIVLVRVGGHAYIGPDNGLFSRLARSEQDPTIIHLNRAELWLPEVSATFHGRDIMAPVAARLSLGMAAEQMGEPLETLTPFTWAEASVSAGSIEGIVESIDSFGNLITNISAAALEKTPRGPDDVRIECEEHETCGIFSQYADQPEMTLIALVGSDGKLELAIVGDSAAIMLGVRVGAPVRVSW
jgi:S-adenosylmethionine hydrolase